MYPNLNILQVDKAPAAKLLKTDNFYLALNANNRIRVYQLTKKDIFSPFVIVLTPSMYENGKGIDEVINVWASNGMKLHYKESKYRKNHYLLCWYSLDSLEKINGNVKVTTV